LIQKKSILDIFFSLFLAFLLFVSQQEIKSSELENSSNPFENRNCSSFDNYQLGNQSAKIENISYPFTGVSPLKLNKNSNNALTGFIAVNLHLINNYAGYLFYARNIIQRFDSTLIIYPFHSFW
jgi:hypothetical protein